MASRDHVTGSKRSSRPDELNPSPRVKRPRITEDEVKLDDVRDATLDEKEVILSIVNKSGSTITLMLTQALQSRVYRTRMSTALVNRVSHLLIHCFTLNHFRNVLSMCELTTLDADESVITCVEAETRIIKRQMAELRAMDNSESFVRFFEGFFEDVFA